MSTRTGHNNNKNSHLSNENYEKHVRNLVPITFGRLNVSRGKPSPKNVRILLDSGSSSTVMCAKLAKKLKIKRTRDVKWTTMAGDVKTGYKTKTEFLLPEFFEDRLIEWDIHLTETLGNYDMIVGRDILCELGIDINFSTSTCTWDNSTIPMRNPSVPIEQSFIVEESGPVKQATSRLKRILDAKYEPANIPEIVKKRIDLNPVQKDQLKALLESNSTLFDGTLGTWRNKVVHLTLKKDAQPYHAKAYPVPKSLDT